MNDGSPTFLSSPNFSSSVIDLSIVSRPLALFVDTETTWDLHNSNHFPIRITVRNAYPSYFRYLYKFRFSATQFSLLQARLFIDASKFSEEFFSQTSLSPVQKYERFCALLKEIMSSVLATSNTLPQRRRVMNVRFPAPWCAEAIEHRRTLCWIYRANPSWDNWKEYTLANSQCQRILKREKKADWRNLCSSFSHKTPTTEIWRFVKAFKSKTTSLGLPVTDYWPVFIVGSYI